MLASLGRRLVSQFPTDAALELVSSSQANFHWRDLAATLGVDSAEISQIAAMQESEDRHCRRALNSWRSGGHVVLRQLLTALTNIDLSAVTIQLCRTQLVVDDR